MAVPVISQKSIGSHGFLRIHGGSYRMGAALLQRGTSLVSRPRGYRIVGCTKWPVFI